MLPTDDAASPPSPSLADLLGLGLLLPKMALQQLFAMPGDALPQGITRLTSLSQADVCRFADFGAAAQYDQALRQEAGLLYYYAQAGWLAYHTVLGEAIRAQLHGAGTEVTAVTVAAAELITEGIVRLLEKCVPTPTRETTEALEALFEQEKHGLVPCLPALVAPAAAGPEEDEVWLTMRPEPQELNLFGFAVFLTHTASYGVPHRLGQALADVAALGPPPAIIALGQRFKAAHLETAPELKLTGADVIRLYLSLQVLALLLVADLQPQLMQRLDPALDHTAPWNDPEQQQRFVTYACTQAEAVGMLFDDMFGEQPAYQAAKATAQRLAALV